MPKMTVILDSCPNPDFQQYAKFTKRQVSAVKDLADAVKKCDDYITRHDLGGGNWTGGQVLLDGKPFAYISYNMRVWEPDLTQKFSAWAKKPNETENFMGGGTEKLEDGKQVPVVGRWAGDKSRTS